MTPQTSGLAGAVKKYLELQLTKDVATGFDSGARAALGAWSRLEGSRPPTESEQVMEFMEKFNHMFLTGQGVPLHRHPPTNHPRHLTLRKLQERFVQMQEELIEEFYDGMHEQSLEKMADALIDLVYFAKGTANLLGLPWEELWNDVHSANMRKVRGEKTRGGMLIKVDCVKPPGWVGPRTLDILKAAGYRPGFDDRSFWDDPEHCPGGPQTAEDVAFTSVAGAPCEAVKVYDGREGPTDKGVAGSDSSGEGSR